MASDGRAPLRGWVDFPQYTRHSIPLFLVREQLALHGLHVVTAADKAVLDAMRGAGQSTLLSYQQTPGWLGDACRAELARRGELSPEQTEALSWRLDAERRVLKACTDAGKENLEFIAKAGSGPVVAIARATLELLDARQKETKDAP